MLPGELAGLNGVLKEVEDNINKIHEFIYHEKFVVATSGAETSNVSIVKGFINERKEIDTEISKLKKEIKAL